MVFVMEKRCQWYCAILSNVICLIFWQFLENIFIFTPNLVFFEDKLLLDFEKGNCIIK